MVPLSANTHSKFSISHHWELATTRSDEITRVVVVYVICVVSMWAISRRLMLAEGLTSPWLVSPLEKAIESRRPLMEHTIYPTWVWEREALSLGQAILRAWAVVARREMGIGLRKQGDNKVSTMLYDGAGATSNGFIFIRAIRTSGRCTITILCK